MLNKLAQISEQMGNKSFSFFCKWQHCLESKSCLYYFDVCIINIIVTASSSFNYLLSSILFFDISVILEISNQTLFFYLNIYYNLTWFKRVFTMNIVVRSFHNYCNLLALKDFVSLNQAFRGKGMLSNWDKCHMFDNWNSIEFR